MPSKRTSYLVALAICALLGALLDFVFNGVFKIVWIVIYGPAYVVAAKVLHTQLSRLRPSWPARPAIVSLFAGALACHLLCVGHTRQVAYLMTQVSNAPMTFRAADWPQTLVVTSDKLTQVLGAGAGKDRVPVVLNAVLDYGCYQSLKISTVAGVDVQTDPDASWTWRMENRAPMPTDIGPGSEDRSLPWCLLKFYRGMN
jgi:hypothetical protein